MSLNTFLMRDTFEDVFVFWVFPVFTFRINDSFTLG